jgi:hypothetical protein
VQLLDDISRWMDDPVGKTVFWLTGVAGTGKTTVAQSVAQMASEWGHLSASFFFSHASEDRRDYSRVIPTIAYQLARDLRLRPGIAAAVDSHHDIVSAKVSMQARELLFDVLRTPVSSQPPSCMLVILDALDECNQDINKIHGGELIPILLAGLKDIPLVKVFVTSRPEPSIEAVFREETLGGTTETFALHRDIEEGTVQLDISRYFTSELAKLRKRIPKNLDFPTDGDVRTLVKRADTLFIYARTAVEYISDPYGQPDRQLAALVEAKPGQSSGQFSRLDDLYSQILRNAHGTSRLINGVDHNLRTVLSTLVLVQQPLLVDDLAVIAGVNEYMFCEYLQRISALLNYQHDADEPVRLMHLSFS